MAQGQDAALEQAAVVLVGEVGGAEKVEEVGPERLDAVEASSRDEIVWRLVGDVTVFVLVVLQEVKPGSPA
eukprot:764495-Hanusia_phi.AAC.1